MRIWDISPEKLCRSHLLGEHRELHAIWSILIHNKKGYARHPEILRWKGKQKALFFRHEALVCEMQRRHYHHRSPLNKRFATGKASQNEYVDSYEEQRLLLKKKHCTCRI